MGSQGSSSSSRPLTAAERSESYLSGRSQISNDPGNYGAAYVAPLIERRDNPERLSQGDWEKLQAGLEAPIARQQQLALKENDQAMSDRGIFTSLNAIRSNDSTRETFAPQFAAAGATATQMKAEDINRTNNLLAADTAAVNAANMENANRRYESGWRPADYKAGLWNGTGGVISGGSAGGWSI